MNVDYQLRAGIDSAIKAENDGDYWSMIVREGEVKTGDLVTNLAADERHPRTFEVIGLGAPFHLAEVYIEDPEDNYCMTVTLDCQEAVQNFDRYEKVAVCQAFLKPASHHCDPQPQNDSHIALASGWG